MDNKIEEYLKPLKEQLKRELDFDVNIESFIDIITIALNAHISDELVKTFRKHGFSVWKNDESYYLFSRKKSDILTEIRSQGLKELL